MPAPSDDRTFHVRPSNDGVPLSTALRKMLGGVGGDVSWGQVRTLVGNRHVTVNGNLCLDDARPVKAGDVVHVFAHPRAPLPTEADVVVRYMDEHLVVIEKPAGLNTLRHREETDLPQKRKDKAPTLDELLQKVVNARWRAGQYTRTENRPAGTGAAFPSGRGAPPPPHPLFGHRKTPPPPGPRSGDRPPKSAARNPQSASGPPPLLRPVHRLDRDTSGLMLFALSPQAEQALERDFARHVVERVYHAVVAGQLTEKRTFDSYFVRDRGDGLRGSSPLGANAPEAQHAITHVTPLEPLPGHTLVECRLETGRTHQIRIHLSEAGHPLAGEKTYVRPPTSDIRHPTPDIPPPPRHFLHSHRLRFTHPATGKPLEYVSTYPRDLAGWLKRLRSAAG